MRAVWWAVAFAAGIPVGFVALVAHRSWLTFVAATFCTLTFQTAMRSGAPRVAFTAGWIGVIAMAVLPLTADQWVLNDVHTVALFGLGACVVAHAIATLPHPDRTPPASAQSATRHSRRGEES